MENNSLSIQPIRLGALPIVEHYINSLGIESLFENIVPGSPRDKIPVWKTLTILLSNIIIERHPLYKINQWSLKRNLLSTDQVKSMTDDRVGRSLDRLFHSDRASLITNAVL